MHNKPIILIVDDTPENLRVLGSLLENEYEVRIANNGFDAFESASKFKPDLILLDIVMPGMDGYEVCTKLKANIATKLIPIIFISALGLTEQKIKAFRIGAVDYITKPFQTEEVLARVRTHLQLSKFEELKREIEIRIDTEEKLKHSESHYRSIFENANDAIFLMKDDKFIDCNTKTIEIFGCNKEHILNNTPYFFSPVNQVDGTPSKDKAIDYIKKTLNGIPQRFEWQHCRYDKSTFDAEVSLNKIELNNEILIQAIVRDITERKKSEEIIREKERRIRAIFDLSYGFIGILLPNGTLIEANQTAIKFAGVTPTDVLGKPFWETPWWSHSQEMQAMLQTSIKKAAKGETIRFEASHTAADGTLRIIDFSLKPVFDDFGKVTLLIPEGRDITERKLAEQKMKESEERFRLILENMPILLNAFDENGNIIAWNNACEEATGYNASEVIGNPNAMQLFYPDPEYRTKVLNASLDQASRSEVFDLLTKQGDVRTIEWFDIYHYLTIPGWASWGMGQDITERKKAEEALRESEEKLSTLFGAMTEMVILHEVVFNDKMEAINYRITDCNNIFVQITGIRKENAIGKLATEVYQTEIPPFLHEFTQVGITGLPYEYTTYYEPMDKHFMISVVSPQKNKFATITTDITAIKQIQDVISAKNKELENYLYVASHDLRSPLVNIHGFSLRLQKQTDAIKAVLAKCAIETEAKDSVNKIINEDLPKTLGFIFSNVTKMDTLINGLLQISRTGRIVMTIKNINMNQLFKTVLEAFNYQITDISAKIIINNLPHCYGDENQLNQLFSNIIGNAIKYRDVNRQLIIEIAAHTQYNKVIYSINDTGTGIAQRHIDKIWDVFFRVDSSSPIAGDGIGLSLAKRIAEKHKGKIWANSEEGKGSTFYVELQKNEFAE